MYIKLEQIIHTSICIQTINKRIYIYILLSNESERAIFKILKLSSSRNYIALVCARNIFFKHEFSHMCTKCDCCKLNGQGKVPAKGAKGRKMSIVPCAAMRCQKVSLALCILGARFQIKLQEFYE